MNAIVAPGKFTISRTGSLDASLFVYLSYEGMATAGSDYESLPTQVEIPIGQASADLQVKALADSLTEGPETVVAHLIQPPTANITIPYDIDAEHGSATVTINDVPPTHAVVSIVATIPNTAEPNPNTGGPNPTPLGADYIVAPGKFTISRTGSVEAALNVYLSYGGSATPGSDYETLPGSIEIPAGQASADLLVQALADTLTEGPETVVANILQPPTSADSIPYNVDPDHATAMVTIVDRPPTTDLPIVSIDAARPTTSEPLPTGPVASGLFVLHRTGPTNTSFYAYVSFGGTATAGADYTQVSSFVLFKEGQSEARVEIVALADDLVEGDETVVAELTQPPTGSAVARYQIDPDHHRAVVTIKDEDAQEASIQITDPLDGAVVPTGGTITVKATAVDPNGYFPSVEFFSDDVSIGVSTIAFLVAPPNGTPIFHQVEWHNIPIGPHKLTARGTNSAGETIISDVVNVFAPVIDPPPPATVSIRTVVDPTLRPIPNADYASDFFEIRRTFPTNEPLQVYFTVPLDGDHMATPDVDYHALKSPVTIPAGAFSAYMRVDAIDDTLVEGPEIVRVMLEPPPASANVGPFENYRIDQEHASADVTIIDNDQPPGPVVLSVEVPDGIASEISNMATAAIDTATFRIRRQSGPLDVDVTVFFGLSGTAQNGVDYKQVEEKVALPAGADHVDVTIIPIADNIVEGEETVVLTLLPAACAAIFPPPPGCYQIGEPGSGRAVIVDQRNAVPTVKFLQPVNGEVFSLGNVIQIEAQAWDDSAIAKLQVLADGQLLGETNSEHIFAIWGNAAVGEHSLVAKATDGAGQVATSEIHILVRDSNAEAFVFRKLPPGYTPGTSFVVELRAEPPAGARAYAVEDHPPTNWVVSEISNDGVYDPATGKVKFGLFTDATARTLTYRVTPPGNATGRQEFVGVGSVDGVNYRIGGDRLIEQSPTEHPADTNKDFTLVVDEVTAYAASWKSGGDIPISYVTRAGYLWKHGEAYQFDGTQPPPLCWAPIQTTPPPGTAAATTPDTDPTRTGGGQTQPGISANLQIHIAPPSGTSAYAVEETVPPGWTVSNVSNDGTFDATTGVIRWGVFFDATERTLTYTLTPPTAVTCLAHITGRVSFDGVVKEIVGGSVVTSTDDTTRPVLAKCEADASGKVHLELSGGAGQVAVLQSSTDFVNWQDVTTLYLPDGTVQFDDNASAALVRYYRLQVR